MTDKGLNRVISNHFGYLWRVTKGMFAAPRYNPYRRLFFKKGVLGVGSLSGAPGVQAVLKTTPNTVSTMELLGGFSGFISVDQRCLIEGVLRFLQETTMKEGKLDMAQEISKALCNPEADSNIHDILQFAFAFDEDLDLKDLRELLEKNEELLKNGGLEEMRAIFQLIQNINHNLLPVSLKEYLKENFIGPLIGEAEKIVNGFGGNLNDYQFSTRDEVMLRNLFNLLYNQPFKIVHIYGIDNKKLMQILDKMDLLKLYIGLKNSDGFFKNESLLEKALRNSGVIRLSEDVIITNKYSNAKDFARRAWACGQAIVLQSVKGYKQVILNSDTEFKQQFDEVARNSKIGALKVMIARKAKIS